MNIKWTDKELAIIEAKAEVYTVKQIASILKRRGYQRTPVAIYLKLNNLGYSARPTLDNYSCKEIAQVLQWLILGIGLVNNSWFYLVELVSPTLTQSRTISNRFSLVGEKSLVRVNV